MADTGTAIPGLVRLGKDAERVADLYPRPKQPTSEVWQAFPVDIPPGLRKLTDGHCGYGN